ncbi:hypothetical protein OXPF_19740 [Oxobacter pfennigii]|uniref:Uncharacterized protein n=1 Tax=Oxobacter pfennigii TaxID=36849 RepID=A0A0N8NTC9_9CLOT|nr:CBO0543 family protein [Oxobacter pfennigii]KPU44480.1 hypothetical protein OXPF_19740 [Oxobacter pfennigii]
MPEASGVPQSVDLQRQLTADHIEIWLAEGFLKLRWWVLIVLYIVCAVVWWKLLDKRRLKEILVFTALAYIAVLAINEYGQELILWGYPTDVLPVFPPFSSVNLLLLPTIYSLIYQHFSSSRSYFVAESAVTVLFCVALEPLLAWGGFFELLNWKYWLSIPVYAIMALLVKMLTVKVLKITVKSREAKGW